MTVRLFVRNLNPRTTERQLSRFFSSAGMAVSAEVPIDVNTGLSRGFGFVDLDSEEQAERALIVFDGRRLGNRELRLERTFAAKDETDRPADRSREERRRHDDDDRGRAPGRNHRDDYTADRRVRRRRHGKHGSDRIRGRGTRRVIE